MQVIDEGYFMKATKHCSSTTVKDKMKLISLFVLASFVKLSHSQDVLAGKTFLTIVGKISFPTTNTRLMRQETELLWEPLMRLVKL